MPSAKRQIVARALETQPAKVAQASRRARANDQRWVPISNNRRDRSKLERLRASGIERLVRCIDQNRHRAEGEPLPDARIIPFKTWIDARAALAMVAASRSPVARLPRESDENVARGCPKRVRAKIAPEPLVAQ